MSSKTSGRIVSILACNLLLVFSLNLKSTLAQTPSGIWDLYPEQGTSYYTEVRLPMKVHGTSNWPKKGCYSSTILSLHCTKAGSDNHIDTHIAMCIKNIGTISTSINPDRVYLHQPHGSRALHLRQVLSNQ